MRENGGQYTHAAIWASAAFAALGDSRRAWELFGMINPVNHSRSPEGTTTYKVEPYVVAADVYALPPHTGRGGWTWYTGSAGWMYRLIVESFLGLRLEVDKLRFAPCLPADWKEFKLHYRHRETVYHIAVTQTVAATAGMPVTGGMTAQGAMTVTVDGIEQGDQAIPLVDDRQEHSVEVRIDRHSEKDGTASDASLWLPPIGRATRVVDLGREDACSLEVIAFVDTRAMTMGPRPSHTGGQKSPRTPPVRLIFQSLQVTWSLRKSPFQHLTLLDSQQ